MRCDILRMHYTFEDVCCIYTYIYILYIYNYNCTTVCVGIKLVYDMVSSKTAKCGNNFRSCLSSTISAYTFSWRAAPFRAELSLPSFDSLQLMHKAILSQRFFVFG